MSVSVLVVDDSVVIRRLVSNVLDADPDIEVVGTAPNGRVALSKLDQLRPDVITLDVEMPVMDGLATLREVRARYPQLPVIMFSTLTARGAATTLDALSLGASDYVTKPANVGSISESMNAVRVQLVPKVKALAAAAIRRHSLGLGARPQPAPAPLAAPRPVTLPAPSAPADAVPLTRPALAGAPRLLVVGCSTGGPDALTSVLSRLPGSLPLPVLVVQHMPPVFTRLFAERLDRACPLTVREAADGDVPTAGQVFVAPGDWHMTVHGGPNGLRVGLNQDPPEHYCRPAVDVLFRSAAANCGSRTLAVVLTGMGSDGARGAQLIQAAGGRVLVQDEASSVVWGMPGAVVNAGAASAVLPLPSIADEITTAVLARPSASAGRP